MCFSPEADLVGGAVIGGIGVDVVRHVDNRRSHMALAALPLILGAHQLDEAFVWWGKQGHVPSGLGTTAMWVYLLIALVLLPIFVPTAVLLLEPTRRRRMAMVPFAVIGAGVAIELLIAMIRGPVGVTIHPYHLSYSVRISDGFLVVSLYVVAVCGALLLSGFRSIAFFGVANLVAVIVIAKLTIDGFASIWCAWAAITSVVVALHMRLSGPLRPHHVRGSPVSGSHR